MAETKPIIFQNLMAVISIIIAIYPFIAKLNETYRVIAVIVGGIGVWYYLQYVFEDWITEKVLESKSMEKIKIENQKKHNEFERKFEYFKGCIDTINCLAKNKKGAAKGLDPITVIVGTIVIILIVLIITGRI